MHSISPFFVVSDVARSVAFYCERLGFEVRFQQPETEPFFAIVGRGDVQIFLKSEGGVAPLPNAQRHPHLRWDAYVNCPEPDALAAELIGRGVVFSAPLANMQDGLRGFEISDPDGYVLFFGRPR